MRMRRSSAVPARLRFTSQPFGAASSEPVGSFVIVMPAPCLFPPECAGRSPRNVSPAGDIAVDGGDRGARPWRVSPADRYGVVHRAAGRGEEGGRWGHRLWGG